MYRKEVVCGIKVVIYGKVGNGKYDIYKIPCFDHLKNKR